MVLFRKSVYKDRARVIVRSKLPEFQELPEQQFDTELCVTWQECLANRGITVSEIEHVVKTKKTKCMVTDTVEEMTMCYKRDVVLRIWICRFSPHRPPRKPQRLRNGLMMIDERSLLSEDSAGEPEDSQDEGEGDEDPEDVFFRPPVLRAANETTPPRRGRGRPRKIPARFIDTPSPEPHDQSRDTVSAENNYFQSLSRNLRSAVIDKNDKKSYKSSSKLPNFGSRIAMAQKKKNDDLLAKLPPHVKKVRINFENGARRTKVRQGMTATDDQQQTGPSFAGSLQRESTKIFLLHNHQNVMAGTPSPASQIVPVGTSRIIESPSKRSEGQEKDSSSNMATSPLKRYAGADGGLPKKKFAASEREGPLLQSTLAVSVAKDQWWGNNGVNMELIPVAKDLNPKSLTIVPNSTKWGAPSLMPPLGGLKQLIRQRVEIPLHATSAPVLTPNNLAKAAAGKQKTVVSSLITKEAAAAAAASAGLNISEECLLEMPKLEVQAPLSQSEEEDMFDLASNPFIHIASNVDFLSNGSTPDVIRPISTVTPVAVSQKIAVTTKKMVSRPEIPTCSRNMKQISNSVNKPLIRRIKKIRPRIDAKQPGPNGKKPEVSGGSAAPAHTTMATIGAAIPNTIALIPPKLDPDEYDSQDEIEDPSDEDVRFKKSVYHYFKRLKPIEFRLMQTELRNLRSNSRKEYGVCKEIPYSFTALSTALKV